MLANLSIANDIIKEETSLVYDTERSSTHFHLDGVTSRLNIFDSAGRNKTTFRSNLNQITASNILPNVLG